MADITVPVGGRTDFELLYKDQGGGVYVPGVASVDSGPGGGGTDDSVVFPSASRTSTPAPVTFVNAHSNFLRVVLDLTSFVTAAQLTLTIDGLDSVSGKWINILTGPLVTSISTTVYIIGPGLGAVTNQVVNSMLVRNLRVGVAHGNTNAVVYSVGKQLT